MECTHRIVYQGRSATASIVLKAKKFDKDAVKTLIESIVVEAIGVILRSKPTLVIRETLVVLTTSYYTSSDITADRFKNLVEIDVAAIKTHLEHIFQAFE